MNQKNEGPELSLEDTLFALMAWMLNGMSMGAAYESWNDSYARISAQEFWSNSRQRMEIEKTTPDALVALGSKTLWRLGFRCWEKKDGFEYWLIPLWLAPHIAYGDGYFDFNEQPREYTKETDLDVRAGCIAVCIKVPEQVESTILSYEVEQESGVEVVLEEPTFESVPIHPHRDDEHQ